MAPGADTKGHEEVKDEYHRTTLLNLERAIAVRKSEGPDMKPLDPMRDRNDLIPPLLRALERGLTLRQAAFAAGVHVATVCRWQSRGEILRRAIDPLTCFKDGVRLLRQAGKTNHWLDAEWLLTRPLQQISGFIRACMPFVVHQGCRGEGCLNCRSTGYLTEEVVELLRSQGLSESEAEYITVRDIRSMYPDELNECESVGEADVGDLQQDAIPD
jgi:hypothetical protein